MRTNLVYLLILMMSIGACRDLKYPAGPANPSGGNGGGGNTGTNPVTESGRKKLQKRWNEAHQNLQDVFTAIVVVTEDETSIVSEVNYEKLKDSPKLSAQLDDYFSFVREELDVSNVLGPAATKAEGDFKMAFWINMYNACTIRLVRDHYTDDLASIKDIRVVAADGKTYSGGGGLFSVGIWDAPICEYGKNSDQVLNLNQIEHGILRNGETRGIKSTYWMPGGLVSGGQRDQDFVVGVKLFDNRLHYLVNCASESCPRLPVQVVNSNNLQEILEKQKIEFWTNGAQAVSGNPQFYKSGSRWYVNSIFINKYWYKVDFPNLTDYIVEVRKQANQLNGSNHSLNIGRLREFDYQWSLNYSLEEADNETVVYEEEFPENLFKVEEGEDPKDPDDDEEDEDEVEKPKKRRSFWQWLWGIYPDDDDEEE